MADDSTRLNKFIAGQLSVGRRAADDLISGGKVKLNGAIPELGARVRNGDTVTVNGKSLNNTTTPDLVYVLFNKPVGYVCSRRQQGDAQTIYSVLPAQYQHLKPVGRLDKNSSGLLLLTNDGDTAHHLLHPSFAKVKQYQVALDQPLQPLHQQMICDYGIALADGVSKLQLQRMHDGDDRQWLVIMHEGRNRQIRRTFSALGYEVTKLHRTHFGPYSIDQLHGKQMIQIPRPL